MNISRPLNNPGNSGDVADTFLSHGDVPAGDSPPFVESFRGESLPAREKRREVSARLREEQGMEFPDLVDFSPSGIAEAEKSVLARFLNRPIWYVHTPRWGTPPPPEGAKKMRTETQLIVTAEHMVKELGITAEGWRYYTLLVLPPDPGKSAALTAAIYRLYGVWPVIAYFQQPDPLNRPGLVELAGIADLGDSAPV